MPLISRNKRSFAKRLSAASTANDLMPKIRRQNLPPVLLNHLLARIKDRQISADQLGQLADWLDSEPEVPEGRWFKRFSGMTVCGEGELVKTFLIAGQAPNGKSCPERSRTGRRHFWIRLGSTGQPARESFRSWPVRFGCQPKHPLSATAGSLALIYKLRD